MTAQIIWMLIGLAGGVMLSLLAGFLLSMLMSREVRQGTALIVTRGGRSRVSFARTAIWPILDRAEVMDISVKTLIVDRRGADGVVCKDSIRADIAVSFYLRVDRDQESILRVASSVGCERASDMRALDELFIARFSEGLKTVATQWAFEDMYRRREQLREELIDVIGVDLDGFLLEDVAVDYLEMTPLAALDPNNVLDAQCIRRVTEITAAEAQRTKEIERQERRDLGRQQRQQREEELLHEQQALERELEAVRDKAAACLAQWESLQRQKQQLLDGLAGDSGVSPPGVLLGGGDAEEELRRLEDLYRSQLQELKALFETQLSVLQTTAREE